MLKRLIYNFVGILFIISSASAQDLAVKTKTKSNFEKLAGIENVVMIDTRKTLDHFEENYELWFEQPIDHGDLSKGTFRQKVYLGFENSSAPVIVELQGYWIYTENAGELAAHYQANQLTIEHRYFNESRPEKIDWNTLNVENAAKDQANIINSIRKALFPESKFISTGISKGCQTVMAHRSFFPKNVDACVCYVGPLNYEREDPRVYEFLANVGTKEERDKVKEFQDLCFENKEMLLQTLRTTAKGKGMSWEFGEEKALEYSILEYSFAFWQWGAKTDDIPTAESNPKEIYTHLIDVVGYGFFEEKSVEGFQPYFWQALTEQGIYGYETAPFKDYLNTEEVYKFDWAFPTGITKPFDPKPMQRIKYFLDNTAERMLFIYGEYDAWSSTAVELESGAETRELYKFVKPKGDHTTRIKTFSEEDKNKIYAIIDRWLEE